VASLQGGAGTKSCTFVEGKALSRKAGSSIFYSKNSQIKLAPEKTTLLARLLLYRGTNERNRILFPLEEKTSLPP
jgi:hypothetical protein